MQVVPLQKYPAAQSPGAAQLVLHAVAPQVYGVHGVGVTGVHAPAPLQFDDGTAAPPVHDARLHVVPVPGYAPHVRRLDPSHCAWHAPVPPHAVRVPWGGPTTGEHVPAIGASHASHSPVHAVSQQTESTQLPVAHWAALPAEHVAP